ncbi:MAG: helix-turn-helix transcriptional regulator [Saprospiraceae bacterium]|nr:helix-turn-helix transcriptional regulator [Saprospiraceae bacterium]
MDNTYDYLVSRPKEFKQLVSKDVLFLHYICPQFDKYLYLFNHFNTISFTLGGNKIFHHGSRSWTFTEDTTLFAKKTAWKQEMGTLGWEILAFYFPDDFLCRFFNEHRQLWPLKSLPEPPSDAFIEIKITEATRAFFYSILPYFSQQPPPSAELLELKFKELLFNILSDSDNAGLLAYISSVSDQHKPPLYEIMEANYVFNMSITEFARITQRSVSTFKRDFERHYHTSPGRWLTEKRIGYAKMLLDTSKKNISEIAYDSGFESSPHFSRVFKESYGLSPSQYREKTSALHNAIT